MGHRFRFIGARGGDGTWRLSGEEARHLGKVLRLDVGAEVEVTDGLGAWALGRVAQLRATEALIEEVGGAQVEPRPAAPLIMAIGALKPGGVDEILPALTELGVDRLWIFQQAETAKTRLSDKVVERWRRIVTQAVKQCKRSWVPELETFASLEAVAERAGALGPAVRVALAQGGTETLLARLAREGTETPVVVVCGGEKGLSPEEEETLRRAGFSEQRLGPHVLRAVTAAVAAAAVVAAARGR